MGGQVLPLYVNTHTGLDVKPIEATDLPQKKKPEEEEAMKVVGVYCPNPEPKMTYIFYLTIAMLFLSTTMTMLAFLVFTQMISDKAEKTFPDDVYKEQIMDYYTRMICAMITMMLMYGFNSLLILIVGFNTIRKHPKSPVDLITKFLVVLSYCVAAMLPLTVWLTLKNQPIPMNLSCVFFGFYFTALNMLAIRTAFKKVLARINKYRIKNMEDASLLRNLVVEPSRVPRAPF